MVSRDEESQALIGVIKPQQNGADSLRTALIGRRRAVAVICGFIMVLVALSTWLAPVSTPTGSGNKDVELAEGVSNEDGEISGVGHKDGDNDESEGSSVWNEEGDDGSVHNNQNAVDPIEAFEKMKGDPKSDEIENDGDEPSPNKESDSAENVQNPGETIPVANLQDKGKNDSIVSEDVPDEDDDENYSEETEYGQVEKEEMAKLQDDWVEQKFDSWKEELRWKAQRCRERMATMHSLSMAQKRLLEADCGLGYNLTSSPARTKPWRVTFYSTKHNGMLQFTSCPTFGKGGCPLSPECSLIITDNPAHLPSSDVVVVYQKEPRKIWDVSYNNKTRKPFRVMLWREALWPGPHEPVQRTYYDLELGTHHNAGIPNLQWFLPPSDLLSGRLFTSEKLQFIPVEKRTRFAISIISHCDAPSMRDAYIAQLEQALGPDKIHRYGECGTRQLPPRPISNAAKLIAKYKFYLSFENTIQEGYVTEKLTEMLALPVLPVYYGAPNVPNITTTPSFIKASDFRSPERLAEYLMYLDAHPKEYNKYHAWRSKVNPFDDYYLNMMKDRIAGPLEVEAHTAVHVKAAEHDELNYQYRQRRAQCCRLCDENLLTKLRAERTEVVPDPWTEDKINDFFFDGKMYPDGKQPSTDKDDKLTSTKTGTAGRR